jgi:hypothetical protein
MADRGRCHQKMNFQTTSKLQKCPKNNCELGGRAGGSDGGHGEVVVGRPAAGRAARVQTGGEGDGTGGDCSGGAAAGQAGNDGPRCR